MAKMKAYKDCDEWLYEIENYSLRAERMTIEEVKWAREAWKQATRSARVQEMILLSEMKKLREELQEMEGRYNTVWDDE